MGPRTRTSKGDTGNSWCLGGDKAPGQGGETANGTQQQRQEELQDPPPLTWPLGAEPGGDPAGKGKRAQTPVPEPITEGGLGAEGQQLSNEHNL